MPSKAPNAQTTQKTAPAPRTSAQKPPTLTQSVDPVLLQHAWADPVHIGPAGVLALQRTVGNRATRHLIQAKLTVGPAGDRYEQEADRVAERAMNMPAPVGQSAAASGQSSPVQRAAEEEEEVQTKPLPSTALRAGIQREAAPEEEEVQTMPLVQRRSEGGFEAGGEIEQRLSAGRGGGSPLSAETRAYMEPRFGADFSGVRIHAGAEAVQMNRELQARAFTHGQDIYLGAGAQSPGSAAGNQLLAHELTHTIQQGAVPRSQPGQSGGLAQEQTLQRADVIQCFSKQAGQQIVNFVKGKVPTAANRVWDIIKTAGASVDREKLATDVLAYAQNTKGWQWGTNDVNQTCHRAAIEGITRGAVCDLYQDMVLAEFARSKGLLQGGDVVQAEAYAGHSYNSVKDGQHLNDRGEDWIVDAWRGWVDKRKTFHFFRKYRNPTGAWERDARAANVDWTNDPEAEQVVQDFLSQQSIWRNKITDVMEQRAMTGQQGERERFMKKYMKRHPGTTKGRGIYPV